MHAVWVRLCNDTRMMLYLRRDIGWEVSDEMCTDTILKDQDCESLEVIVSNEQNFDYVNANMKRQKFSRTIVTQHGRRQSMGVCDSGQYVFLIGLVKRSLP